MKLKNKKTGEIVDIYKGEITLHCNQGRKTIHFKSLEDLEEWEDYEEPKDIWWLDNEGNVNHATGEVDDNFAKNREIGNYFDTREEAENVVEKLKAWKRLKDKGVKFGKRRHSNYGGEMYWECPSGVGVSDKQIWLDLDLLFGGEE